MNRNFVVPVLVAAAFHGGLFFGVPRGEAPQKTPKPKEYIEVFSLPPMPKDEEVVDFIPDKSVPKGDPDNYRPQEVDRPTLLRPDDIPMDITPPTPRSERPPTNLIPMGPSGDPNGERDVPRLQIFSPSSLDSAPRTRVQPPMPYPHEARRAGMTGTVTVEFMVDETGRVYEARALDSSDRIFEAAALAGVSKWRFEPGRRDGKIVRFRMAVPIVFSLNQ